MSDFDQDQKNKLISVGVESIFEIGKSVVKLALGSFRSSEEIRQSMLEAGNAFTAALNDMKRRAATAHEETQKAIEEEERRQAAETKAKSSTDEEITKP
jgi:hypothetical protein